MGRKARDKRDRPVPAAAPETAAAGAPRPEARPSPVRRASAPWPQGAALWILALAAAAALAYAGALGTPFLLDDPINITKNPQIQRPLSLFALAGDPRAVVSATLHWNWALGGFDVTGYHVLNIAAHAIAGAVVFLLAWTTLRLPVFAGRYARREAPLAAVVALLFLLHPMQTESVTYVIQRAEIFVGIALAGALLALAAMRQGIDPRAMALLAACCVLGTWSKPSFAVAPSLLAAFDLLLLGGGRAQGLARRWPAYALATVAAVVTFALTKAGGGFHSDTAGFDVEGITPLGYLSAQFGVVVQYLRVALWPDRLCFDCGYRGPWPVLAGPLGDSVAVPAALLAALAAASLAAWKKQPLAAFAVIGSAIVLAPTSTVVPLADFYVEHRMYLPLAFLALALAPAMHDGLGALARRLGLDAKATDLARVALAIVVVVALGSLTVARNRLLADPIALMEDALEQAPQNERVHYNLANALRRAGRPDEAIPHYEAAIRLLPNVVRSYENLGSLYLQKDRVEDALRVFQAGAAASPGAAMAHRNVATALLKLRRPAEALEAAQKSLALEPRNANGHRLAGDALMQLGRRDEAVETWRKGLSFNPGEAPLKERLANAGAA